LASTETGARRRKGLAGLLVPTLLFLGVFSVYLATAERQGVNTDAYAASAGAWRLATSGTPWFDGLDVTKIDGTHKDVGIQRNGQWLSESPNGHVAPQRMPGPILAGVPFYWVFSGSGTSEADFSLAPAALAASFITSCSVLLMFLALRPRVPAGLATGAALVFAFATPTWTVSANGLWTHTVTQFGLAGAVYAASRGRWWLTGVFLATGMLGRPHLAILAAILGLGVAWSRRDWRVALKVGLPTTVSLVLVATWSRVVHGIWAVNGGYNDVIDRAKEGVEEALGYDLIANYAGFFVAFQRGFFVWTPVVLLFLPALFRARKVLPDWSLWLVIGGLVYTLAQLRLAWFGGGIFFYGYRHGLELLSALVPALVFSAPYLGRLARSLVPVVVAVQFATLSIGAFIEGMFIPPEDFWRDNSFWHALLYMPEVLGAWLLLAVGVGVVVAIRYVPSVPDNDPGSDPRPEPAQEVKDDARSTAKGGSSGLPPSGGRERRRA